MQVNRISNINFRENTLSREMHSENAILMLRDPNAAVRFQQSQEYILLIKLPILSISF